MGRPGGGGGGGHRDSSSHSSGSSHRSASSHRSSSTRPLSRPSGYSGGSYGGFHSGYSRVCRAPSYGFGHSRSGSNSRLVVLAVACLVYLVVVAAMLFKASSPAVPRSTMNRERLTVNHAYQTDCVWDELDWIDTSQVSRSMQKFYDATGVQPALALFDYKEGITGSDNASEQYAKDWYDSYVEGEGALLLAYFDTGTEEEGWAYLIYGDMTKSVIDGEAEDIFWSYYDRYWTDDSVPLTKAYPAIFVDTGKRIMQKTTTGLDILKWVVIGVVFVLTVGTIIIAMKVKRRNEAEKAAETERILNTPLETAFDSEVESLAEEYSEYND